MGYGVALPQNHPSITNNEQPSSTQKSGRFSIIGKEIKTALNELAMRVTSLALDGIALAILLPTQLVSLKALLDPTNPLNKSKIDPNQPPVLMIHGFLGRSNHWIYHRNSLADKKVKNLFTVDLGSPTHSIEEYAAVVQKRIEEIKTLTGRSDIIIVSHSMGGLVADAYKKLYAEKDNIKILDTITIGTPLTGTKIAYLAALWSKAARQMLPSSAFSKTRSMESPPQTFTKENGTTITESIVINEKGVKITCRSELSTDKTLKQIAQIEDPTKNEIVIHTTTTPLEGPKTETEETIQKPEREPKQEQAFHIGSKYDTIVPYNSSISQETDIRDKVTSSLFTQETGGHGWQLFSPDIQKNVYSRIMETITKIKNQENLKDAQKTVSLDLNEPVKPKEVNTNLDTPLST